jgi:hypothetical protein
MTGLFSLLPDITAAQWAVLALTGLFIGMAKTGLFGLGTIMVPVMAYYFGGKLSTGIISPMLVFADLFGVFWYRQHSEWKHLAQLLPWSFAGILLGTLFGNQVDDEAFKLVMGLIVLLSVIIMVWRDYRQIAAIPDYRWLAGLMGLAAGFTTMVGNLAGAVTALYFLTMRLPKNNFIGTAAWFYLIVNLFKLPLHVFAWHTITTDSFVLNLAVFPVIAVGAFIGLKVTRYIPDESYRKFTIAITVLSAVFLFL